MQGALLRCVEKSPGRLECTLDLSGLYPSRSEFVEFKNRYDKFLRSDKWTQAVYKVKGNRLIYQSEQLIPSKRDGRPPLLLVFGNPASHSVKAGCFFAFKDGRENRFWKFLLAGAGVLRFDSEKGISEEEQNSMRARQILSLEYESPFRIGLCVYFSMPSSAGGSWSGVAGLRRLLGGEAWKRVHELERGRILNIARKFIKGDGIVVTFQKDAWEGLRSMDNPAYNLTKAREGKLRGSLHGMEGVRLACVPPTRLLGPSRDMLRRTLLECGCRLLSD
jgi:hypothetical protein